MIERTGPHGLVPLATGELVFKETGVNLVKMEGTILILCPPGLKQNAVSRNEKEWATHLGCSSCNFQHH